jgi:hypothetical protein
MHRIVHLLAVSTIACMALAQRPSSTSLDNPSLTNLFESDQSARRGDKISWQEVWQEDEDRRKQVRVMLNAGEVRTATDYFHAALVFQHGAEPEDYLLAHILAVNSVILGDRDARWLAAATLDRYLNRTGKPQVFGTQFGPTKDAPLDQLPINAALLSDSTRTLNCVIPLPEQKKMIEGLKNKAPFQSTSIKNCP